MVKVFELGIEHRFICVARTNKKDAECFFAGLQRQVASGNELGERCCDMLPDSYLVLGVKVALEALDPFLVCDGINLGEYGSNARTRAMRSSGNSAWRISQVGL